MGSGKSLISNKLISIKKIKKIDLDFEISKELGLSIPKIFEKRGELFFRKKEKEILERIFSLKEECILSLGGGTPCYYNNIEIINN